MVSAPETFMAVANATAAIVEKAPPFVTYRVHGVFHVAGEGTTDRTVTVRSEDGLAVVHDDVTGKDELRPPFPAPPTFDALASFQIAGNLTIGMGSSKHRDGDLRIINVHPLHYENTATHADAVARAVKGYIVSFADDATPALGHLHLERNVTMTGRKWMRDVWYDTATLLPTRIVWGGINDFVLDSRYAIVGGHWLLQAISVSEVAHAPMWLGRMSVSLSGTYAAYTFADVAPDPRLGPGAPLPSPAASP